VAQGVDRAADLAERRQVGSRRPIAGDRKLVPRREPREGGRGIAEMVVPSLTADPGSREVEMGLRAVRAARDRQERRERIVCRAATL